MLTASLFCWVIWIARIGYLFRKGTFHIARLFVQIFLPSRYLKRLYRFHLSDLQAHDRHYDDLADGYGIITPKRLLWWICFGYVALPMWTICGIITSLIGRDAVFGSKDDYGFVVILLLLVGPTLVGTFILAKPTDDAKIYLPYFKQFAKEDSEWLETWKSNTRLLTFGSLVAFILGWRAFVFGI